MMKLFKRKGARRPETIAPLAAATLKRDLDGTIRYPMLRRIRDWRYGVIDGKVDADVEAAREGTSAWLHRLHSEFAEATSHELQSLQSDTAQLVWQFDSRLSEVEHAREALQRAMEKRSSTPDDPGTEELARRGVAEQRDSDAVIRARRLREYRRRVLGPVEAEVGRAKQDLELAQQECGTLRAQIDVTHDVYVARIKRLLHFHQRRAATYRRGFVRSAVRRQADREVIAAFARADALFALPGWAQPHDVRGWVPAGNGHVAIETSTEVGVLQ